MSAAPPCACGTKARLSQTPLLPAALTAMLCALVLYTCPARRGSAAGGRAVSAGAATRPATRPAKAAGPAEKTAAPPAHRNDALPGVVELSDGRVTPGWLYTTREQPFEVYVERTRRWRRIPFICVLSISAVVVEEKMELGWRWKSMGEPERIYTGKKYPTRRLRWRFHLIDDSYVEGAVKGRPLWVEYAGRKSGPMVLQERSKGPEGQDLKDLIYVKRIIVSRRLMDAALADRPGPDGRQ